MSRVGKLSKRITRQPLKDQLPVGWSSFRGRDSAFCALGRGYGMLLEPATVHSGFLLFIAVLKIPKEPAWNTSLVLLAGDRIVDCLISKQRGFMVSFWRVASWKGSVEKSTFSFIFRLNLRLQACRLNWGCWARIVFTSSPNLLFSKNLRVFTV